MITLGPSWASSSRMTSTLAVWFFGVGSITRRCSSATPVPITMSSSVFPVDMERWAKNYKYLGTLDHWKVDKVFDTGPNAPETHSAEEARQSARERFDLDKVMQQVEDFYAGCRTPPICWINLAP